MRTFVPGFLLAVVGLVASPSPVHAQGWGGGSTGSSGRDFDAADSFVELRIERQAPGVTSLATAVLIEPLGRAATTAYPLIGATGVEAVMPGVRQPIGVEPLAVDPELNLALVQVRPTQPTFRARAKPRRLIDAEPNEGQAMWLLWFDGEKTTAWPSAVTNTALYRDLDRRTRSYQRHAAGGKWIEVETETANAAHKAAFALDAGGRLAGIVPWLWLERRRTTPILASVHIAELLEAGSTPIARWTELDERIGEDAPPPMLFPRLQVTPRRDDRHIREASHLISHSAVCQLCKGWGTIERKRRTGYESIGGGMRRPVYEYEDTECPRCKGDGLARGQTLARSFDQLVDALARLRPVTRADQPQRDKALASAADAVAGLAQRLTSPMADRFNSAAAELFDAGPGRIGQPVVLMGQYVPDVSVPGRAQPVAGVRMGKPDRDRRRRSDGDDRRRVLVLDPQLVGNAQGEYAVVGGLLAGFVQYKRELPLVPVLTDGMIVPLAKIDTRDDEKAERQRQRRDKRDDRD